MPTQLTHNENKPTFSPAAVRNPSPENEGNPLVEELHFPKVAIQEKFATGFSGNGSSSGGGSGEESSNTANLFNYLKAQPKLTVGAPNDKYEREADRVADQIMKMPELGKIQRVCTECEEELVQAKPLYSQTPPLIQRQPCEEEEETLQATSKTGETPSVTPGLESRINSMKGGGQPLDPATRNFFESRFGHDFSQVRVHSDSPAADTAKSINARAFTLGNHVAMGSGEYQPNSQSGQRLLGHELTHVLHQEGGTTVSAYESTPFPKRWISQPAAMIQRQETPEASAEEATGPSALPLPGGLTLFPGAARLVNFEGVPLRLPASLRLTNALGLGPGPSFVLDLAPDALLLSMLNRIDLSASPTPGAAPSHVDDPEQQARVSLVRPILHLNPSTGNLTGTATLQVPSGYPLTLHGPTELDVRIESSRLGQFTGQIALGPLHADMTMQLHYDTDRIGGAVRPAFAPRDGLEAFKNRLNGILLALAPGIRLGGLQDSLATILRAVADGTLPPSALARRVIGLVSESLPADVDAQDIRTALTVLAQELTHPGFTLDGTLGLNLPFGLDLPLSTFSAEAPTTVPLERPLLGAPAPFPLTTSAGGVIIAPPGAVTDIAVPALGYAYSSFGAASGTSFTAATLPTLSPTAISTPGTSFAEQFPVYAFAEFSHVRRFGNTIDLGVRVTLQFSTPDLAGRTAPDEGDLNAQIQQNIQQLQSASRLGATATPAVPNIGLTVFGNF